MIEGDDCNKRDKSRIKIIIIIILIIIIIIIILIIIIIIISLRRWRRHKVTKKQMIKHGKDRAAAEAELLFEKVVAEAEGAEGAEAEGEGVEYAI